MKNEIITERDLGLEVLEGKKQNSILKIIII